MTAEKNRIDPIEIRTVQKQIEPAAAATAETAAALSSIEQTLNVDPMIIFSRIEAEQRDIRLDLQTAIRVRGKTDAGIFRRLDHLDNLLDNTLPALRNSSLESRELLEIITQEVRSIHHTQDTTDSRVELLALTVSKLEKESKLQKREVESLKEKRFTLTQLILLFGLITIIGLLILGIFSSNHSSRGLEQLFQNQQNFNKRLERIGG